MSMFLISKVLCSYRFIHLERRLKYFSISTAIKTTDDMARANVNSPKVRASVLNIGCRNGTYIVAICRAKDNLYAFTSSGDRLWSFNEPTNKIFGKTNVGPDGTIYSGSWDTYVYAVNSDGLLKWKYQTDVSTAPLASPTLSNDGKTIYVGSVSGDQNKDAVGTLPIKIYICN